MTIAQLLKKVGKKDLAFASKLPIRELEEEQKGMWIAYVDDKENSYDVQVHIKTNKIETFNCDCDEDVQLCKHKVRMLLALQEVLKGEKVATSTIKKAPKNKKLTALEELFTTVEQNDINAWFVNYLKNNKEAEREFLLTFKPQQQIDYTEKGVQQIVKDVISSVLGKRKKADTREIKKIIDLLAIALKPVNEFIAINIGQPIALNLYLAISGALFQFEMTVQHSSKRIKALISEVMERQILLISNIQLDETYESVFKDLLKIMYDPTDSISYSYASALLQGIFDLSNGKRRLFINDEIVNLLKYYHKEEIRIDESLQEFFLHAMIGEDRIEDCYQCFSPIIFNNDFNQLLLDYLIDIDMDLTEKYCRQIINQNIRVEYNIPYYRYLEYIYETNEDMGGLVKLKMAMLDLGFDLESYLFVMDYLTEGKEKTMFRTKVLSRLRNSFIYNPQFAESYYAILENEENYKKMLEVADSNVPLNILCKYLDQMYAVNQTKLLSAFLRIGQVRNSDTENSLKIVKFILDKYPHNLLQGELRNYVQQVNSINSKIAEKISKKTK